MEIIDPSSIQYAAYNPRTMSGHDANSLDASMTTFADIAGITYNVRSNTYVTGHQRIRTLQRRFPGKVRLEMERQEADEFGTVGYGYVVVDGTRLKFAARAVDWNEATEKTVNIAANRIEANWNEEMLAEINRELGDFDNAAELLKLTGQTQEELDKLAQLGSEPENDTPAKDDADTMSFKFTEQQAEVVNEALGYVLAKHNVTSDNLDIRANAIAYICRDFLDKLHGLNNDSAQTETKEEYLSA